MHRLFLESPICWIPRAEGARVTRGGTCGTKSKAGDEIEQAIHALPRILSQEPGYDSHSMRWFHYAGAKMIEKTLIFSCNRSSSAGLLIVISVDGGISFAV